MGPPYTPRGDMAQASIVVIICVLSVPKVLSVVETSASADVKDLWAACIFAASRLLVAFPQSLGKLVLGEALRRE